MDADTSNGGQHDGELVAAAGTHPREVVRWSVIDRTLARFTADSLLAVVSAALDSPWCRPWEYHLALVWARAVRRPSAGRGVAQAADLAGLVSAAIQAAPGRPVIASRWPNDPRQLVGFSVAGRRWRVHPGDIEHPVMLLRQIAATARAVDPMVMATVGFTLTDVLELVLAHGHRRVDALAAAWPGLDDDAGGVVAEPMVAEAEVAVVAGLLTDAMDTLPAACSHPERAAAALAWLTRDAGQLTMRHVPPAPVLGAVLRVTRHSQPVGVPACLTLSALTAATQALIGRIARNRAAATRLQALTVAHAAALFSKQIVDRSDAAAASTTQPPLISGHHFAATVVSAVAPRALSRAINWASQYLHSHGWREHVGDLTEQEAATLVKVVVYGGPGRIGFHTVGDTILIHIEELVEILADAAGDWTTVGCFLEELGRHARLEGVVFLDILDVWWVWRDHGVLGPLGPAEHSTVLRITPYPRDPTWSRAADWERVDAVLAAAGVPEQVDWPHARREAGDAADLFTTVGGRRLWSAPIPRCWSAPTLPMPHHWG